MAQLLSSDEVASLPAADVLTEPDSMLRYSHDEAEWAPYGIPLAVVRPVTAAETQAWCAGASIAGCRSCRAGPGPGCPEERTRSTAR